ncbi:MAG: aminomethyl transferase family protein, partial [Gemmatimonadetes bacterium]|nr:aminomethyl transferase family protein [Gemmatimonadota bacterium]
MAPELEVTQPVPGPARAVRDSVVLSRLDHLVQVRVSGGGAYEGMSRVFPRELYVRDGQLSQGLLLREDGVVWADCLLGNDEGDYILLCEGPGGGEIVDHIRDHCQNVDGLEVSIPEGTSAVGIDGPYAWELMANLVGPEVIGLPYLTFFHFDGVMCCRAGKTGEYGYVLLAEADDLTALWDELWTLGATLDVEEADLDLLDSCALENWFFNIRAEGSNELTPLELQLQWRLSRRKTYIGSEALKNRLEEGIRRRITCITGEGPLVEGDDVHCDGSVRGRLVNA